MHRPPAALPTRQRPPVERTTASAMARPRPAPTPSSVARWNLSKSRGCSAGGIPGPLSRTDRLTLLAMPTTWMRTVPPGPAYRQALSTRTPVRRSIHSGGALIQACSSSPPLTESAMPLERAMPENLSAQPSAIVVTSTGSSPGGGGSESKRASHRRSSTMRRRRALSRPTRSRVSRYLRGVVLPGRSANGAQRQVYFRFDDTEGRSQLVRGIGGELELPASRLFNRAGRLEPYDESAQEHGDDEDRTSDDLRRHQNALHVLGVRGGFARPPTKSAKSEWPAGGTRSGRGSRWWAVHFATTRRRGVMARRCSGSPYGPSTPPSRTRSVRLRCHPCRRPHTVVPRDRHGGQRPRAARSGVHRPG